MMLSLRSTFLEAKMIPEPATARALSAPPARSHGSDRLVLGRLYASTLCERSATLRAGSSWRGHKAELQALFAPKAEELQLALALESEETVSAPAPTTERKSDDRASRFTTGSTTCSDDMSNDSQSSEDEAEFARGVRSMTQAILRGQNPKQAVRARDVEATPGASLSPSAAEPQQASAAKDGAEEQAKSAADEPVTTIMICNLPCRIMEANLAGTLATMGLEGRYDFLFIPKSHRPGSNLGYAFLNLLTPEDLETCTRMFSGYRFKGTCSTKACSVKPARIQGAERNMAQFSGRSRKTALSVNAITSQ